MSHDDTPRNRSNREQTTPTRRDVLRKTGAATAGGLAMAAFSGTGGARQSTIDDVGGVSAIQVDASLATAGHDVLETLAGEGLLSDASPFELPTARKRSIGEVAANLEGRATVGGSDDVLRHVTVTHLDDGVLTVTVEPNRDRSYAFFEPAATDEKLVYDPHMGLDGVPKSDVGTQDDCATSCDCSNVACSTGKPLKECTTCCCHSSCGDCCCSTDYSCC